MDDFQKDARSGGSEAECQDARHSLTKQDLARDVVDYLYRQQARMPEFATDNDWYLALAHAVRDRVAEQWINTFRTIRVRSDLKIVCYLSMEFLLGPQLGSSLLNLDMLDEARQAMRTLGLDLDHLLECEQEPGLGNGGLGRLAACYLDSLATLEIPAIGFGIRYEFGIFDQEIKDGWQIEKTDKWLRLGNPWEIHRPEEEYQVKFGGTTESYYDEAGCYRVIWNPDLVVKGVAYDTPVPGYRSGAVNQLRLWKAEACESFDYQAFNVGDYYGAVNEKVLSETVTKVLYPNDEPQQGKVLRLSQEYFFVACSLQNLVTLCQELDASLEDFPKIFAVQLNDTHPSIAVPELMRLLVDEHQMEWDKAWDITQRTFGYTNHTLLPEALEKWPLKVFQSLLPRHLEIIYEINQRFLTAVSEKYPADDGRLARLSVIDEEGEKYVRMAHLACVGAHAINGVAALHTELLKNHTLRDFYEIWPEKFYSITNGVTPRRWLALSNPELASLISGRIGEDWILNAESCLRQLGPLAEDPEFRATWRRVKLSNKQQLASFIRERMQIGIAPESMFDVQVKRIHEYKRQHLNVLHVITLYNRIKHDPRADVNPRTFIFGGKAAPSYFLAKLIIKLINSVAAVINNDTDVGDRIKVVFIPNFNVKIGQRIYPAADLSEQISLAGKEASGTGNMKFAMNGALTIGTLDGANVEIREEVGAENFFLFGLTADEAYRTKSRGYNPRDYYETNSELREAIDMIGTGYFSEGDTELFKPLIDCYLESDEYMVLADYQSYVECQDLVAGVFGQKEEWTRMSILNTARMGIFSSDRAIQQYCKEIWDARAIVWRNR
jgi:glycogen phosphorylase